MKMTRDEMMDEVMRKYGFENDIALTFCRIAETWESDLAVEEMFVITMAHGYEIESEEE